MIHLQGIPSQSREECGSAGWHISVTFHTCCCSAIAPPVHTHLHLSRLCDLLPLAKKGMPPRHVSHRSIQTQHTQQTFPRRLSHLSPYRSLGPACHACLACPACPVCPSSTLPAHVTTLECDLAVGREGHASQTCSGRVFIRLAYGHMGVPPNR